MFFVALTAVVKMRVAGVPLLNWLAFLATFLPLPLLFALGHTNEAALVVGRAWCKRCVRGRDEPAPTGPCQRPSAVR